MAIQQQSKKYQSEAVDWPRGRCFTCGVAVEKEFDGLRMVCPTHCMQHTLWDFECNNGHRWRATRAEDKKNGHRCPTCGGYWV